MESKKWMTIDEKWMTIDENWMTTMDDEFFKYLRNQPSC
jgi:hypothetical protein